MSECGSSGPSSLECRQIAELLGDYLEGTLPGQTRELLEWHIEGCAPCVAFVNTYRGTTNAARKLRDVELPPALTNRLLAVLRRQPASHEPPPSLRAGCLQQPHDRVERDDQRHELMPAKGL